MLESYQTWRLNAVVLLSNSRADIRGFLDHAASSDMPITKEAERIMGATTGWTHLDVPHISEKIFGGLTQILEGSVTAKLIREADHGHGLEL